MQQCFSSPQIRATILGQSRRVCGTFHCNGITTDLRAVFNWESKVVQERTLLPLTTLCYLFRKIVPPPQPIRCKLTQASGHLYVYHMRSHWLLMFSIFDLIGHCEFLGFGSPTKSTPWVASCDLPFCVPLICSRVVLVSRWKGKLSFLELFKTFAVFLTL